MYIIDNITMAMLELYNIGKTNPVNRLDSNYFILKLDDINKNKDVSKYFSNGPIQNISDILVDSFNEIFLGYSDEHEYLEENQKGKIIRETFFKKDVDGAQIFLGSLIGLTEEVYEKLGHYFKNAILSPNNLHYDHTSRMIDIDKFSKISNKQLLDYKEFIDDNLNCYASLIERDHPSLMISTKEKLYKKWRRDLMAEKLDYRLEAYDKACELALDLEEPERV